MVNAAFENRILTHSNVLRCYGHFRDVRDVENDSRSRWPFEFRSNKIVKNVSRGGEKKHEQCKKKTCSGFRQMECVFAFVPYPLTLEQKE